MSLEDELKRLAAGWATEIQKKAKSNLGNKKSLIEITYTINMGETGGSITFTAFPISVSEYGDLKRVARAYEYGSGIHARFGAARKYEIRPKRKKVLAFYWDIVDTTSPSGRKFIGISSTTGKALFNYVEHPGVEAAGKGQGYLRPAIESTRKGIGKGFTTAVRDSYADMFKEAFRKQ